VGSSRESRAVHAARVPSGRGFLWAGAWGVGAGIGVALGAWLTVAGQSGVPGGTIDTSGELIRLPLLAAGAVFAADLGVQVVIAAVRRRRTAAMTGTPSEHSED
jgi:hypothetical protein